MSMPTFVYSPSSGKLVMYILEAGILKVDVVHEFNAQPDILTEYAESGIDDGLYVKELKLLILYINSPHSLRRRIST